MTQVKPAGSSAEYDIFAGGGEMGRLMQQHAWENSPFGPVKSWPQSLRSALSICLNSSFPTAIYWGPELRLLYNDAWAPIPADRHPWALGRPGAEVWKDIWSIVGPQFERAMQTGEGFSTFNEMLPMERNGVPHETYWNYSFTPIRGENGKVVGIFNQGNETTEQVLGERRLRESEERLRLALDAASAIGIWNYDIKKDCVTVDASFASLFHVDIDEASAGTSVNTFMAGIHPDDREAVQKKVQETIETAGEFEMEYRLLPQGGADSWVLARGRVYLDDQGQPERFPGVAIDITARKQIEDALKEADRRKDEFIATLAHELRNPLAPISNALQIMEMKDDLPTHRRMRNIIGPQLRQMVHLVDDLMDISRITQGKIELRRQKTGLADIVAHAVETVRPFMNQRAHKLTVDLPGEDVWLDADHARLSQVFANILNNAAKYTPEGGDIRLSASCVGGSAIITIEDNGLGIPPEQLPRVFDMFSQVESALGRAQGGLGIGLTLVRQLVALHGGRVEARSEGLGKGSRFIVTLPAQAAEQDSASPQAHALSPDRKKGRVLRVLVVDDNTESANTLGWMIELLGHETRIVYSGTEALEEAAKFRPHIVLLDIGMPQMNGYEVCKTMKAMPELAGTTFIAQSGWSEKRDQVRSLEAGFRHHMVKPVTTAGLEKLLAEAEACQKEEF